MPAVTERFVTSGDGTRIAVWEEGDPDAPAVVLVHGWPDSHVLWDGVAPLLAGRFRVVRYDNRGVGKSDVPRPAAAYSMARFADDFAAVAAAVSPQRPVHVLAHDWGSVGVWEYLGRPGAASVVASFTSVSGPSSRHLNRYVKDGLRMPYRPRRFGRGLAQLARLSYMGAFSTPVLAPAAVRLAFARGAMTRRLTRAGVNPTDIHHSPALAADAARSMKVYRANYFRTLRQPRTDHEVGVPVQLIVNRRDPYVRPYTYDEIGRWVPQLWRRDLDAGHWAPMSHPAPLAAAVGELVDHLDGAPPARTLARARVGLPRAPFGDQLVSITGAGSGIGRATALAFAERGAEVVVSDLDEAAAAETAAQIAAAGGTAHSYRLDVADADAVERFAEQVCETHGVPDIVINNAGVGQAGFFLDTPAEEYARVLDINFGGVINGCRSFGKRLADRGIGGHIVNVASMASYAPLNVMNAYCTSKAAVFMFSDCLRAELDSADVKVSTICPGVVGTNIVEATRFSLPEDRGYDADTIRARARRGFAVRRVGPDKVAKAIIDAVRNNKPVRPVNAEAYLVYGVAHAFPQVMRSTARGGNIM